MRDVRRPATAGLLAASGLVGLYVGIVRVGSASWAHAVELLATDWYLVAAVATGFGVQIGLFTHLRRLIRQRAGLRSATAMAAGGTATSTTSMVACCLHHASEVLPAIGLSGAAVFFTTYKVPVILAGLATNAMAIGLILRAIRRHPRAAGVALPVDRAAAGGVPAIAGASEVPPARDDTDAPPAQIALAVLGMSCASCMATVEGALKSLDGVRGVSVNLAAGQIGRASCRERV